MRAPATMKRRLSQPPRRGHSQVTAAKRRPVERNSNKYVSGASQTKCRLTWKSRAVGLIHRHKMRALTSSNPAARPQLAARTSTSRGPVRRDADDRAGLGEVAFRSTLVGLPIRFFRNGSIHGDRELVINPIRVISGWPANRHYTIAFTGRFLKICLATRHAIFGMSLYLLPSTRYEPRELPRSSPLRRQLIGSGKIEVERGGGMRRRGFIIPSNPDPMIAEANVLA
jgi:hypothetical protein